MAKKKAKKKLAVTGQLIEDLEAARRKRRRRDADAKKRRAKRKLVGTGIHKDDF